jgi:hypothetical protein
MPISKEEFNIILFQKFDQHDVDKSGFLEDKEICSLAAVVCAALNIPLPPSPKFWSASTRTKMARSAGMSSGIFSKRSS